MVAASDSAAYPPWASNSASRRAYARIAFSRTASSSRGHRALGRPQRRGRSCRARARRGCGRGRACRGRRCAGPAGGSRRRRSGSRCRRPGWPSPASTLVSVVLPAPLRPTRPMRSPGRCGRSRLEEERARRRAARSRRPRSQPSILPVRAPRTESLSPVSGTVAHRDARDRGPYRRRRAASGVRRGALGQLPADPRVGPAEDRLACRVARLVRRATRWSAPALVLYRSSPASAARSPTSPRARSPTGRSRGASTCSGPCATTSRPRAPSRCGSGPPVPMRRWHAATIKAAIADDAVRRYDDVTPDVAEPVGTAVVARWSGSASSTSAPTTASPRGSRSTSSRCRSPDAPRPTCSPG